MKIKYKCIICGRELDRYIGKHLKLYHNLSKKEYYDTFFYKANEDKCKYCGKLTPFLSINKGYQEHCCQSCSKLDKEKQKQYEQTCIERHGCKNTFQIKDKNGKTKAQNTWIKNLGVDNPFKSDKIKTKITQTNLEKIGVKYPAQNSKIHKKQMKNSHKKYKAPNGKTYDSSWEYKFEQYLIENHIQYIFQPDDLDLIWYDINGKPHEYYPDFKIFKNEKEFIIEIKGKHFFDKNGTYINPYDMSEEGKQNALLKYNCMIKNNVKILKLKDLQNIGINVK